MTVKQVQALILMAATKREISSRKAVSKKVKVHICTCPAKLCCCLLYAWLVPGCLQMETRFLSALPA